VVHKAGSKGGVFANVASVTPLLPKMQKMKASGEYKRVQDRDGYIPPAVPPEDESQDDAPLPEPPPDFDDSVPF
jgi:hypothetical protein